MDNRLELYEYWCKKAPCKQGRYVKKTIYEDAINPETRKKETLALKTKEDRFKIIYDHLLSNTFKTYGYDKTKNAMDLYFYRKANGSFISDLSLYQFLVAIDQFVEESLV